MKKALKITAITILGIVLLLTAAFLLVRFAFHRQATEYLLGLQRTQYVELLRQADTYGTERSNIRYTYRQDTARKRQIREYFRLDTLVDPAAATWDNTLALARFVASNIPHANQSVYPQQSNAIALWEYSRTVEPAFNCRLHSIMLNELLTASDITSRFITCMPADSLDSDCHVVNIVWLPERQKWAMIDSDMRVYVTDADGTPLSLREMRERYVADAPMQIQQLLDDKSDPAIAHYRTYWSKNLYWFACWENDSFDKETDLGPESGRMIYLISEGTQPFNIRKRSLVTTDADSFWAAPDSLYMR